MFNYLSGPLVAYGGLKTPNIAILLGKFWYFGKLVAYDAAIVLFCLRPIRTDDQSDYLVYNVPSQVLSAPNIALCWSQDRSMDKNRNTIDFTVRSRQKLFAFVQKKEGLLQTVNKV